MLEPSALGRSKFKPGHEHGAGDLALWVHVNKRKESVIRVYGRKKYGITNELWDEFKREQKFEMGYFA